MPGGKNLMTLGTTPCARNANVIIWRTAPIGAKGCLLRGQKRSKHLPKKALRTRETGRPPRRSTGPSRARARPCRRPVAPHSCNSARCGAGDLGNRSGHVLAQGENEAHRTKGFTPKLVCAHINQKVEWRSISVSSDGDSCSYTRGGLLISE